MTILKKKDHERLIELMAKAAVASDSGPEGSTLFDVHWREFGEGYKSSMRAALPVVREFDRKHKG